MFRGIICKPQSDRKPDLAIIYFQLSKFAPKIDLAFGILTVSLE